MKNKCQVLNATAEVTVKSKRAFLKITAAFPGFQAMDLRTFPIKRNKTFQATFSFIFSYALLNKT